MHILCKLNGKSNKNLHILHKVFHLMLKTSLKLYGNEWKSELIFFIDIDILQYEKSSKTSQCRFFGKSLKTIEKIKKI